MDISIIILSISILIITTVLAAFSHKLFKRNKNLKPIYLLLAGAFMATFIIMFYVDHKPNVHGSSTTFFLAVFHSIQVMLLGYDFEFLYVSIDISEKYSSFAYLYTSFLFFITPAYTFGFVLSFFESITSYIKFLFNWRSDIYILSDISDKSLILATSIREKYPKAVIAFMKVVSNSYENNYDYIEDAKNIKAILFKKDFADVGLKFHSSKTKATFFSINDNESVNLESSLKIIENFHDRKHTELYVFSTSKEGELLLDSVESGMIKVRRINEFRSLAYSIISNNLITEHFTPFDDKKVISTLIIGFGGYGEALTKALLWCGQLPDYELELNIIDKNPDTESCFRADCPEIISLNGNRELGEARYNLTFYNGVDVRTHSFNKVISELSKTSVVYVSLGNDELNIETAINIRMLFERTGIHPVIRAVVYSDIKSKTLNNHNLVNHCGESYDIEIIADTEERFSYDTIINEELEALALECHLRWSNSPEEKEAAIRQFNKYEYYRNSSIATAIHEKYRKEANLPEDIASIVEHMRWNAYMRTEGFVFSGSCDKSTRNDRAKMHNNLHKFGLLTDEDIAKDRRIATEHNK